MTVVTLFSSLIISAALLSSAQSFAQEKNFGQLTSGGFDLTPLHQPLLSQREIFLESRVPNYRGSANALIHNAVAVLSEGGTGAGVLLNLESAAKLGLDNLKPQYAGYIVTNFHVVELESNYSVAFAPQIGSDLDQSMITKPDILGVLPSKDLALLGVYEVPPHVQGANTADVETLRVGADVEAVGHPSNQLWTYTRGYISQIRDNYEWEYGDGLQFKASLIQTQTPISPGNSGGPLYTRDGHVAGINAFGHGNAEGLNFAVSVEEFPGLAEAVQKSEQYRENALLWNRNDLRDTANSVGLSYGSETLRDDGSLIVSFSSQNNGNVDLYAVFESEVDQPFFLAKSEKGNSIDLGYFLDHDNPNAIFAVYFDSDSDEEYEYQGWDFNGDFLVDHLVQYAE
jgi:S1-C subfamily serine protease